MEKDAVIDELLKAIRLYLGEEHKVFLFGSWARGDAAPTSDLDIGILGLKKVPNDVMGRIKRIVQAIPTLRSIDVVDLRAKSERFRNSVLRYAKPLG